MGGCLSQCIIHLCTQEKVESQNKPSPNKSLVTDTILQTTLDNECAICLEAMKRDQWVSLLPCGHIFHTQCIFTWLYRKPVCPYCETGVKI